MNYDIVFDFSASPVGGGYRRLIEYIKYFVNSNYKVLFLVHPKIYGEVSKYKSNFVEIEQLKRSVVRRLLNDKSLVSKYKGISKCYFSYGIPIYIKMSSCDWFHLSNTLPFAYDKCSLNLKSKLKFFLQSRMFIKASKVPDVISAESQFSINLYESVCNKVKTSVILRNGSDGLVVKDHQTTKKSIAMTVGVESYKRITMVVDQYHRMKNQLKINELVIVGSPKNVPKNVLDEEDITVTGYLSAEELSALFHSSEYYISASEIENSSVAVKEAVFAGAKCVLSNIPSHKEMFIEDVVSEDFVGSNNFFMVDYSQLRVEQCQNWYEVIESMLDKMPIDEYI